MRIAEIYVYRHELPAPNAPYQLAHAEVRSVSTTLVEPDADNALADWGESFLSITGEELTARAELAPPHRPPVPGHACARRH
ncbi:hypothetical protein ABZ840_07830 [Streptomyces sp. NPDC047117]|uniref:hypothetical protein n=1 Tax=Streptomyces sp. NPDC047117 TaxID=3155379 RepID=UPI00340263CA